MNVQQRNGKLLPLTIRNDFICNILRVKMQQQTTIGKLKYNYKRVSVIMLLSYQETWISQLKQ